MRDTQAPLTQCLESNQPLGGDQPLEPCIVTHAFNTLDVVCDDGRYRPDLVRGNAPLVTQCRIAWAAYKERY